MRTTLDVSPADTDALDLLRPRNRKAVLCYVANGAQRTEIVNKIKKLMEDRARSIERTVSSGKVDNPIDYVNLREALEGLGGDYDAGSLDYVLVGHDLRWPYLDPYPPLE